MTAVAATEEPNERALAELRAYCDDGPLAGLLGRLLGPFVPVPAPVLVIAGWLVPAAVLTLGGHDVSPAALGAGMAAVVLAAGIAAGRPSSRRGDWSLPPLMRLVDYGLILWLCIVAAPGAVTACFALLAALAFRHYDTVYRLRSQRRFPPAWLRLLGGGWEGRLLFAYAFLVAGGLKTALFAAAGVLGAVSVAEAAVAWGRWSAEQQPDTQAPGREDLAE